MLYPIFLGLLLAYLGCQIAAENEGKPHKFHPPHGQGQPETERAAAASDRAVAPMSYNGGPIIKKPVAYVIFYGAFNDKSKDLIKDFTKKLGKTHLWGINYDYGVGKLEFGGAYHDKIYSEGKNLSSENHIMNVIMRSINGGHLPNDQNGIYLVLGSSDVSSSTDGFTSCVDFCAFHSFDPTTKLIFAFGVLADLTTCGGCIDRDISPNGNPQVDSLINVIALELSEAATNPFFDAWYDGDGLENGDLCYNNFLQTRIEKSGAEYNLKIDGKKYLVQSNWNLKKKACSMT